MIPLEKLKILTPLQKLSKNVGDLGKLNCCQTLWKVAQSPINHPIWSHWSREPIFTQYCKSKVVMDRSDRIKKERRPEGNKRSWSSNILRVTLASQFLPFYFQTCYHLHTRYWGQSFLYLGKKSVKSCIWKQVSSGLCTVWPFSVDSLDPNRGLKPYLPTCPIRKTKK